MADVDSKGAWLELYKATQAQERNLKELLHQKASSGVTNARDRLREEYERLILTDIVLAQSKEIESALWKNVFYIVIDGYRRKLAALSTGSTVHGSDAAQGSRNGVAGGGGGGGGGRRGGGSRNNDRNDDGRHHGGNRGNKKQIPSVEFRKVSTKFRAFIQEATGFYHRLIQNLASCYDLNEMGANSLRLFPAGDKNSMMEITDAARQAAISSCHKCYIFLGDLARYRQTYNDSPKKNWSAAREYYNEARNLLPTSGNPYNQLAVIATFAPNNFLALYFYYRSLAVALPFMTARNNIKVLITKMSADPDKTKKFVKEERYNERHVTSPKESIQLNEFLAKFVLLHGALFLRSTDDFDKNLMRGALERLFLDRLIDPELLLKIQIINMSSLYTMCYIPLQDDTPKVSHEQRVVSERRALQLITNTFATMLRYSTKDLESHRNGESKVNGRPADFLPSNVHRSMPSLRLSLKWLAVNIHHVKRISDALSSDENDILLLDQIWNDLATFLTLLAQVYPFAEDTIFSRDVLKEDAELQGFAALRRAIDERPLSIIPPSKISPKAEMQMRVADMFSDAMTLSKVGWIEFYGRTIYGSDETHSLRFDTKRSPDDLIALPHSISNKSLLSSGESEGEQDHHQDNEDDDDEEETDYERNPADEELNMFHVKKTPHRQQQQQQQRHISPQQTIQAPAARWPQRQQPKDKINADAILAQDMDQRQAVAALLSDDDNDLSLIVGDDDDEEEEEEEVVLFKGRSSTIGGEPTPKPAHLKTTGVIGGGRRSSMSPTGSSYSSPGLNESGSSRVGSPLTSTPWRTTTATTSPTVDSVFGGFQFNGADDWRQSIDSLRTSRQPEAVTRSLSSGSGHLNSNSTWGMLSGHSLGNGMISPTTYEPMHEGSGLHGFSSIPSAKGPPPGIPYPTSPLTLSPARVQEEQHLHQQGRQQPRHQQQQQPSGSFHYVPPARPKFQYQAQSGPLHQQQSTYFQNSRNSFSSNDHHWR